MEESRVNGFCSEMETEPLIISHRQDDQRSRLKVC